MGVDRTRCNRCDMRHRVAQNAIALRTVLMYMLKHRYTLPSDEEMTALCKLAIRMTLGLRSGSDDE